MTITPEETPRLANAAERNVYQTLLEQLQPNDRVVPGQRVTDHLKDHEVDFVVAIEGAGIVCLEVKGGDVWHDGDTWWQRRRGHEHKIDPVRQAREACYALREFIEKDDRWTQGRLRWDHVVVLPNAEIADDFALPECPRWKVIDRNNLPTLVDKLKHVLVQQELDRPLLTQQGIEQLSTALSGRGLPQRSVVAGALASQDAADALTEHQAVILDAIRLLNRVEIRGGAGSGKTFLAVEQARRLSRRASAWPCSATPTAWPPTWSASPPIGGAATNWPTSVSSTPSACGGEHPKGPTNPCAPSRPCSSGNTTCRFKWLIWQRNSTPATDSTRSSSTRPRTSPTHGGTRCSRPSKDDETGGLYVFTDEGQRVFSRHGSPPVPLVPLVLDHNLRNTRQIANAFQPLVDHPMRFLGGEGPAVKFVACSQDDAMNAGDDEVERGDRSSQRGSKPKQCSTKSVPPQPLLRCRGPRRDHVGPREFVEHPGEFSE